jgi:hypothetical protein
MVKDVTKKEFMKMANTKIRKNFTWPLFHDSSNI